MELSEKEIFEKYYRACITINLDAIYENTVNLKNRTKNGTKIIAVIKTDGYGHGAIPVAYTIDELVSAYAVATVDEAENLRRHNITKPVYVIGYTHESQLERMLREEIRPTVFTWEMAVAISETAQKINQTAKIHIKIDTGMSRIGFRDDEESLTVIKKIHELEGIEIEGIFTHFATADEKDKTGTVRQLERFCRFVYRLKEMGINIPVKHCANSAAMIVMPEALMDEKLLASGIMMDYVRAGIALYGLYPSGDVDKGLVALKPALELKSHVIYVKDIEPGTKVGYGGTFTADKRMRIATIPIGYGDGYRRSLSNRGYVLIRGKRARILGRVCMDQFMVDVTDIEGVLKDDEVILIGKSGNEELSAETLAELAGETFNYEIVCDLGKRIPRVFCRNGKIVCAKDYFEDKYE
ncbi:MAG: alanine racemase [Lachnospiraceae bacterium]|nr:alanine racemase [Lachnospiraceae bacterium]